MNKSFCVFFDSEDLAVEYCRVRNNRFVARGNFDDVLAVVDGPDDNFAVVSLGLAIDMGCGYQVQGGF